jgi:hypothetical protein
MLQAGTVIPSLSPFVSHVLLVKKKDNTWRLCIDYRKLDSVTVENKFSLPIIDELLDEIAGAKYFTTIDLASGFHQIRMHQADEVKQLSKPTMVTFSSESAFWLNKCPCNVPIANECHIWEIHEKVCSHFHG